MIKFGGLVLGWPCPHLGLFEIVWMFNWSTNWFVHSNCREEKSNISIVLSRYGHMIDIVVLIVTGTLHERDVQELLEKCHPLGMFDRYNNSQIIFLLIFFVVHKIFVKLLFSPSALLHWQLLKICESFIGWCLLTLHWLHTFLNVLHQRYVSTNCLS